MTTNSQQEPTPEPPDEAPFSLGSGRTARWLERVHLAAAGHGRWGRLAAATALIAWLPLLVLALAEGLAWGDRVEVPLLSDFLVYGQLLVAVPILILGEFPVGKRLGWTARELRQSAIVSPQDRQALEDVMARAARGWRARGVDLAILLLILAANVASLWGGPEWFAGTWRYVDGRMTWPGWWYLLVSLSALRFLTLRWLWRLALWNWVLWRTSRLELRPQPTHPDRAGGLAFLGGTQAAFGLLVLAFAVQLSCVIADAVCFRGADLMSFRAQVAAFVLSTLVLMLLPLLVFVPRLALAREEHLMFLSGRGYRGAEFLGQRLRAGESGQLPTEDVSGLCDYGDLFENARGMSPVPIGPRHVLSLAMAAVLPFLPLVFLIMPVADVVKALVQVLR